MLDNPQPGSGLDEGRLRDALSGRTVLLTGHTGFKGGWLALWLHRLGARVVGAALPPPTASSLFRLADVEPLLDHRVDLLVQGSSSRPVRRDEVRVDRTILHQRREQSFQHPIEGGPLGIEQWMQLQTRGRDDRRGGHVAKIQTDHRTVLGGGREQTGRGVLPDLRRGQ